MRRRLPALLLLLLLAQSPLQAEDWKVLEGWQRFANARNYLHISWNQSAFQILEERHQQVAGLQNASQWRERQVQVRARLEALLDLPERPPLNARILGTVEKRDFRCEKLVFESLPGFLVSAVLFLPRTASGPLPAILYLSGHADPSFRSPSYQHVILNLVRKGFVVLAIDPIGQGEMVQYLDPFTGKPRFSSPTGEHSYFSNQCFLAGSSGYRYFVWNGIRALDYLLERKEVDGERIGISGLSGGGFQTAQIAALDQRVAAAAPAAYITSWERLLQWRGPGDGEQNLNRGIRQGITYADLLELRAPRPTLILATTRDYVPIQGTRETYQEARRAFEALGFPEHLQLVEDEGVHGYTRANREALYAFFQRSLNQPGSSKDEDVPLLTREELTVTPTGQVATSFVGQSVFTLNRKLAEEKLKRLEQSRRSLQIHLQKLPSVVWEISGYEDPQPLREVLFRGRYQRPGYVMEKYILVAGEQRVIPLLLLLPQRSDPLPAWIYLHPEGKGAEAGPGGEMEGLVRKGYAVAAPDLVGTGELGPVGEGLAYLGVQLGRSIPADQAADVVQVRRFLETRGEIDATRIGALARDELCPALLHAALLDPALRWLVLVRPLVSYRSVVLNRHYTVPFWSAVPNVLDGYDLPDLAAALAPRKLWMLEIQDQLERRAPRETVEAELSVVRAAYERAGAGTQLTIRNWEPFENLDAVLSGSEW